MSCEETVARGEAQSGDMEEQSWMEEEQGQGHQQRRRDGRLDMGRKAAACDGCSRRYCGC